MVFSNNFHKNIIIMSLEFKTKKSIHKPIPHLSWKKVNMSSMVPSNGWLFHEKFKSSS